MALRAQPILICCFGFGLVSFTLLALASNTNFWRYYLIADDMKETVSRLFSDANFALDRTEGLFRMCYQYPTAAADDQKDTFGFYCHSFINSYLHPDRPTPPMVQTHSQMVWAYVSIGAVGWLALMTSIPFILVAYLQPSRLMILLIGCLVHLLSVMAFVVSIGVWHAADRLRWDELPITGLRAQWPPVARNNTYTGFGWSYIIMWIGLGFLLVSTLLAFFAYYLQRQVATELELYYRQRYYNNTDGSEAKPEKFVSRLGRAFSWNRDTRRQKYAVKPKSSPAIAPTPIYAAPAKTLGKVPSDIGLRVPNGQPYESNWDILSDPVNPYPLASGRAPSPTRVRREPSGHSVALGNIGHGSQPTSSRSRHNSDRTLSSHHSGERRTSNARPHREIDKFTGEARTLHGKHNRLRSKTKL